jgi:hypothetical protein
MMVLVLDDSGVWLAAGRLNVGRLVLPNEGSTPGLMRARLDALVMGMHWQRMGDAGVL